MYNGDILAKTSLLLMTYYLKNLPWRDIFLLIFILVFEVSIHPLGIGPDRRIHDPAVYRLNDPSYLPGDWYAGMAVESGVYTFYSKLIALAHTIHISPELWRLMLYVLCLVVLYYSLIRIGRLFSESFWVVPIVAVFHALLVTVAPPIWLYGPFIQVDGGLAPRSIGIALSFAALFFLLKNARVLPWVLLGIATLIHVSNSFIVFTLFLLAWLGAEWIQNHTLSVGHLSQLFRKTWFAFVFYFVSGGWFVFYVASLTLDKATFTADKFIWTWIYLRAPYMALPDMPEKAWLLFGLHILTIIVGWYILFKQGDETMKRRVNILGLVGVGAVVYFFLFYFFTFMRPWLPGFQFYSIRVVYLAHFVAYLFAAFLIMFACQKGTRRITSKIVVSGIVAGGIIFLLSSFGRDFLERSGKNVSTSLAQIREASKTPAPPTQMTTRYLYLHPEPFLAPPDWYGGAIYLPQVASFKSFGFTEQGLEEWYARLDDVSSGELERTYEEQKKVGRFSPVSIKWSKLYAKLSAKDVTRLAEKYHFNLFLSEKKLAYPFTVVAEDSDFRLYQLRP